MKPICRCSSPLMSAPQESVGAGQHKGHSWSKYKGQLDSADQVLRLLLYDGLGINLDGSSP